MLQPSGDGGALVSIVIPSRDRGAHRADRGAHRADRPAFLTAALKSAISQDYRPLEIIVVDDASQPPIEASAMPAGDVACRLIRLDQSRGAGAARNAGLAASRGEIVAFLDDDDEFLPEKIKKQVEYLRSHPAAVAVATGFAKRVVRTGRIEGRRELAAARFSPVDFLASTQFSTSAAAVRKAALDAIGGFDESLPGGQDRDLWIRLAQIGEFGAIPEVLVIHGFHGDQITCHLGSKIDSKERILAKYAPWLAQHPAILSDHLKRLAWLCAAGGRRRAALLRLAQALIQGIKSKMQAPTRESRRVRPFQLMLEILKAAVIPDGYRRWVLNWALPVIDGLRLYY